VAQVFGTYRSFGGVRAVSDVTLAIPAGQVRGLIGPNGAGKTTVLGLVSGRLRPDADQVRYLGGDLNSMPAHRRARAGIGTVGQYAHVVPGMTVLENVMIGAHSWSASGGGFAAAIARTRRQRRQERLITERALAALAEVGLDQPDREASSLPLGQQRSVQLARALCSRPSLLLLDEPAAGLRAAERAQLARLISATNVTVLLVEHDVGFVRQVADEITVLVAGEVLADGPAERTLADPRVREAYLGAARAGR
jgi:branched-chain amino acid transport system ATP-binding protein